MFCVNVVSWAQVLVPVQQYLFDLVTVFLSWALIYHDDGLSLCLQLSALSSKYRKEFDGRHLGIKIMIDVILDVTVGTVAL